MSCRENRFSGDDQAATKTKSYYSVKRLTRLEFADCEVKMPKGFTDRFGGEGDWK